MTPHAQYRPAHGVSSDERRACDAAAQGARTSDGGRKTAESTRHHDEDGSNEGAIPAACIVMAASRGPVVGERTVRSVSECPVERRSFHAASGVADSHAPDDGSNSHVIV
jgi:hypothetical protein